LDIQTDQPAIGRGSGLHLNRLTSLQPIHTWCVCGQLDRQSRHHNTGGLDCGDRALEADHSFPLQIQQVGGLVNATLVKLLL
jgi:hypothetical protein